jgi:hypothetical protein
MTKTTNVNKTASFGLPMFSVAFLILLAQWLNPTTLYPLWIMQMAWIVAVFVGAILLLALLFIIAMGVTTYRH